VAFRAVRVGIEEAAQTEVLDGLEEGDRVVTTGAAALQDGATVVVSGKQDGSPAVFDGPSDRPAGAAAGGRRGGRGGEFAGRGRRQGAPPAQ
jgi:hypothetical protein